MDLLRHHEFISLTYNSNVEAIYAILRNYKIDPFESKDNIGYTALHVCALNNNTAMVKFLMRYVQEYYENSASIISTWVNLKSGDGFTCLHLAVFRGNLVII